MELLTALKKHFGYDSFRDGQQEVVERVIAKESGLVVFPTGNGKSICFQLPAIMMPGLTIVISPLIALMKDQVDAIKSNNIKATTINSMIPPSSRRIREKRLFNGEYDLLYITPEKMADKEFASKVITRTDLQMVVFDEAHCISQWGHDFRPKYKAAAEMVCALNKYTIKHKKRPLIRLALTASATEHVKNDIQSLLEIKDGFNLTRSMLRHNLMLHTVECARDEIKKSQLLSIVNKHQGDSVIIYAASRRCVEEINTFLRTKGISSTYYHAGLSKEARNKNQDDFMFDKVQVITATNAFGMGLDKSDVRAVIHYNMPPTIEDYYQESGRAGRDGFDSDCYLLWSENADIKYRQQRLGDSFPTVDKIIMVKEFITTYTAHGNAEVLDLTESQIASAVGRGVNKFMVGSIIKELLLAGFLESYFSHVYEDTVIGVHNLDVDIDVNSYMERQNRAQIKLNSMRSYVTTDSCKWQYLLAYLSDAKLEVKCNKCNSCVTNVVMPKIDLQVIKKRQQKMNSVSFIAHVKPDTCEDKLKQLRKDLSNELSIPPYVIMGEHTIKEIVDTSPVRVDQLHQIIGMTPNKVKEFGARVIKALAS